MANFAYTIINIWPFQAENRCSIKSYAAGGDWQMGIRLQTRKVGSAAGDAGNAGYPSPLSDSDGLGSDGRRALPVAWGLDEGVLEGPDGRGGQRLGGASGGVGPVPGCRPPGDRFRLPGTGGRPVGGEPALALADLVSASPDYRDAPTEQGG